ncbi:6-phospho-3-hexuloisomerase [Staphylococcus simiae]|uniref:6-phospho 3-hexuloisomerase n=1 Tax=Staphylococcus simiae CCM 7213 = CCUG 51256 TaxID=911238 RepID=G5JF47_9STAP|nr:6-phospho-3-hexuloisomerase [Staphylococcus simiae]EHJ09184.1 6-phospho 3-hexuloisomerase [Staphylococcus simiae CCM 7213 = CCUG 51256]PNZ10658.1 6-phospho-3-hexuloisomerase [Staphylococcus simiae]
MPQYNNYQLILTELEHTLERVSDLQFNQFADRIVTANRIFVAGKGRSGFVANGFAMRLNQLGKEAYVVGESTTPSIHDNDLFLVISGSGSTEHLRLLAEKSKSVKAQVVLLTTNLDSPIASLVDNAIELPAGTKYEAEGSEQPLGSLFEQASQLFLDSVVIGLMSALKIDEATMQQNHANLE